MSRIVRYILCFTMIISACDPTEHDRYTSRHPILHGMRIAASSLMQRIRRVGSINRGNRNQEAWYTPQMAINSGEQVQWLGHATNLITTNGCAILTDPVAEDIPFHRRRIPFGTTIDALPHIDIIAISHDHYDHLNKNTLKKIKDRQQHQPIVVCPSGVAPYIAECGYTHIISALWWDKISYIKGSTSLTITCVPAHHWSGRFPWKINRSLWCGWVFNGGYQYYFAGDTAYNGEIFDDIAQTCPDINVALLPIAPYHPRNSTRTQHMCAYDISRVLRHIGACHTIPIHWGTFSFGPDSQYTPQKQVQEIIDGDMRLAHQIHPLTVGSTYTLARTNPHDTMQRTTGFVRSSQSQ